MKYLVNTPEDNRVIDVTSEQKLVENLLTLGIDLDNTIVYPLGKALTPVTKVILAPLDEDMGYVEVQKEISTDEKGNIGVGITK